jgi:nitroreductase
MASAARAMDVPVGVAGTVEEAILSRRSIRAYTDRPVPRELIQRLLELAGRAPSGNNIQPWRVYVFTGKPLAALGRAMQEAFLADEPGHGREYEYYTDPLVEPYLGRRRACGWGLYGLLGIGRGDFAASRAYHATNYNFFGAPAGLVFTIDKQLAIGSWLDYGMFLGTLMVAARGFGLATCPEASIASYPKIVRAHAGIGEDEIVVCGMALGYPRADAPINGFQPERTETSEFTTFLE